MEICAYMGVSIDGCIAKNDGNIDWLTKYDDGSDSFGYSEFMDSIDTIIMGRNTYETVISFGDKYPWPYSGKKVVILSSTLTSSIDGTEIYSGSLDKLIDSLNASGTKRVYVDGGNVVSQFIESNTVDKLTMTIVPEIIGNGIRLFQNINDQRQFKLDDVKSFDNGIVQLKYSKA